MAYGYAVKGPVVECLESGDHYSWLVTETEAGSGGSDEFVVDGVPTYGTITLYQAKLTPGVGSDADTLQPQVGVSAGFSLDSIDAVACAAKAADPILTQTPVRMTSWSGKLYGRSKPNGTAGTNTVTTRITLVRGHT